MSLTLILGEEQTGKTLSLAGKISTIENVCNSNGYTLKFVHVSELNRHKYSHKVYSKYGFLPVASAKEVYELVKDYKEKKNGSFEGKTHIFIEGLSYFDPEIIPLLRTLRLAHVGITATLNSYLSAVSETGEKKRYPYPTAPALLAFADNISFALGENADVYPKASITSFVGPMGSGKTLHLIGKLLAYKQLYGNEKVLAVKHSLDAQRNNELTYIVTQNDALNDVKYKAISLNEPQNILSLKKKKKDIKVIGIDETNFFGWQINNNNSKILLTKEKIVDKNLEELLNNYDSNFGSKLKEVPRDYFVYEKDKNGNWWFIKPALFDVVNTLHEKGIFVLNSGLELSCFGEPFSPTHYLLSISDNILKNKAVCEKGEKIKEGEINFTGTVTQRLNSNGEPTSFKDPLIKVGAVGESYFPVCWWHHQIRDIPVNLGLDKFKDLL